MGRGSWTALVAAGEGDAEKAGGQLGLLPKELEKIAQAKK
jgi:hypothetical protein